MNDEQKMREALGEAQKGLLNGEVPIGAVLYKGEQMLVGAHNICELTGDPTAHAEMVVVRMAAEKYGIRQFSGCTLYVTMEPCAMCAGMIIHAGISRVVFGSRNRQCGCCGSVYDIPEDKRLNGVSCCDGPILENECGKLLMDFFVARRCEQKGDNSSN